MLDGTNTLLSRKSGTWSPYNPNTSPFPQAEGSSGLNGLAKEQLVLT